MPHQVEPEGARLAAPHDVEVEAGEAGHAAEHAVHAGAAVRDERPHGRAARAELERERTAGDHGVDLARDHRLAARARATSRELSDRGGLDAVRDALLELHPMGDRFPVG